MQILISFFIAVLRFLIFFCVGYWSVWINSLEHTQLSRKVKFYNVTTASGSFPKVLFQECRRVVVIMCGINICNDQVPMSKLEGSLT